MSGAAGSSTLTLHGVTTLDLACAELVAGWTCKATRGAAAGERFACEVGHAATRVQMILIKAPFLFILQISLSLSLFRALF